LRYTPLSSPLTKGGKRGVMFVPHESGNCYNVTYKN
jgi:hypothetical protein